MSTHGLAVFSLLFFNRNDDTDTSYGIFGHVNMSTVIDIGSHVGVGRDGIGAEAVT